MSAHVWVLRREAKRFRRLCAIAPPMGRVFWATSRRLLDAVEETGRLARLGRRSRYAGRRLDVWLAS